MRTLGVKPLSQCWRHLQQQAAYLARLLRSDS
jgi:hypothetical protein